MKLKAVIAENFEWKPIKYLPNITSWKAFNALLSVMKAIIIVSFHMIYIIISYGMGI